MNPLNLQEDCQSNALPAELQPHKIYAEFEQSIELRETLQAVVSSYLYGVMEYWND